MSVCVCVFVCVCLSVSVCECECGCVLVQEVRVDQHFVYTYETKKMEEELIAPELRTPNSTTRQKNHTRKQCRTPLSKSRTPLSKPGTPVSKRNKGAYLLFVARANWNPIF